MKPGMPETQGGKQIEPRKSATRTSREAQPGILGFAVALLLIIVLLIPVFTTGADANSLARFSRPNARVDWNQFGHVGRPDIAAETNGTLHATWVFNQGGACSVYHARSLSMNNNWSDASLVSVDASGPAIAVDNSESMFRGTTYVAYVKYTSLTWSWDIFLKRTNNDGENWSAPVRIDSAPNYVNAECPDLGVNKSGTLFAVWVDARLLPTSWAIYAASSANGGANWSEDVLVSTFSELAHCPSLTFDNLGRPYVSWTIAGPPGQVFIAGSFDAGSSWTVKEVVSGNAEVIIHGSGMTFDSMGSAYVAWSATNKSTDNRGGIFVSRSDDSQTWTAPVSASHGGYTFSSTFPQVEAGPPVLSFMAGEVYVFWSGNRTVWLKDLDHFAVGNDLDLYSAVSRDRGTTWIGDDRVDDYEGLFAGIALTDPSVSTSRYGIHVIWKDWRLGNGVFSAWSASYTIEALLITEIADSPTDEDFIELFSQSHKARSLENHHIVIGDLDVALDALGYIEPDEHLIVGPCSICDLQIPSLDLPEHGGLISLLGPSGHLLDQIEYGRMGPVPDPIDSESVSRFWTGERYLNEWTRSPPTPQDFNVGGRFDPSIDVVMSEIHLDNETSARSFIELYYKGESSQDLTGFTVVGNEAMLLPPVILDQGNRRLAVTGQELPDFFQTLSPSGDNLYLYSESGNLVDAVGWSSPTPTNASLARLPKTEGGRQAFDDPSSRENGWLQLPKATLPQIELEWDSTKPAPPGECTLFPLTISSLREDWDTIDLSTSELEPGFYVDFLSSDGVSPLGDTDGNGLADIGTLAPGSSSLVFASVCLPQDAESVVQVIVFATSSSENLFGDVVLLEALMVPNLLPRASANPSSFYVEGSPPFYPSTSTMEVSVEGRGHSSPDRRAQDVVILMDASGSIGLEAFHFAKNATATYLDRLRQPDKAAVFYFWVQAKLASSMTSDYELVKERLDFLQYLPGYRTSIGTAIVSSLDELFRSGNRSHEWFIILLTDGKHTYGAILPEDGAKYAWQNNTRVFAIGLCSDPSCSSVRVSTLKAIAQNSNASYFLASSQEDLDNAYDSILRYAEGILSEIAGYDDNASDELRMVKLSFPSFINVQTSTFVDPESGLPMPPDYVDLENNTFEWNVDHIKLGGVWKVSFDLTSSKLGPQLGLLPTSRVLYTNSTGSRITEPFNAVWLNVAEPLQPLTSLIVGEPSYSSVKTFITSHTPLMLEATDFSGSGISSVLYSVEGGNWIVHDGNPFFLQSEGTNNLRYYSIDNAGVSGEPKEANLTVDDSSPDMELHLTGPQYTSDLTYVTSQTEISLISWDRGLEPSGMQSSAYRVTLGDTWSPWGNLTPFYSEASDGIMYLEAVATDNVGNLFQRNWTLVLDNSPPATEANFSRDGPLGVWAVSLEASDFGSGVAFSEFSMNGGSWETYQGTFCVHGKGPHTISYRSVDNIGNREEVKYLNIPIGVDQGEEANYKPLVAVLFSLLLAIGGYVAARRRARICDEGRWGIWLQMTLPFVVLEAGTGILSFATGVLRIPSPDRLGLIVDMCILLVGMAIPWLRAIQKPRTIERTNQSPRAKGQ